MKNTVVLNTSTGMDLADNFDYDFKGSKWNGYASAYGDGNTHGILNTVIITITGLFVYTGGKLFYDKLKKARENYINSCPAKFSLANKLYEDAKENLEQCDLSPDEVQYWTDLKKKSKKKMNRYFKHI